VKPVKTVHTSRTIIIAQAKKVMDHGIDKDAYLETFHLDVFNKAKNCKIRTP
jgi:hypothetical protein